MGLDKLALLRPSLFPGPTWGLETRAKIHGSRLFVVLSRRSGFHEESGERLPLHGKRGFDCFIAFIHSPSFFDFSGWLVMTDDGWRCRVECGGLVPNVLTWCNGVRYLRFCKRRGVPTAKVLSQCGVTSSSSVLFLRPAETLRERNGIRSAGCC